jgi:hypothetical protein
LGEFREGQCGENEGERAHALISNEYGGRSAILPFDFIEWHNSVPG